MNSLLKRCPGGHVWCVKCDGEWFEVAMPHFFSFFGSVKTQTAPLLAGLFGNYKFILRGVASFIERINCVLLLFRDLVSKLLS